MLLQYYFVPAVWYHCNFDVTPPLFSPLVGDIICKNKFWRTRWEAKSRIFSLQEKWHIIQFFISFNFLKFRSYVLTIAQKSNTWPSSSYNSRHKLPAISLWLYIFQLFVQSYIVPKPAFVWNNHAYGVWKSRWTLFKITLFF